MQQIRRANFICTVWNNATNFNPDVYAPHEHGWEIVAGKFSPLWFQGDMVPSTLKPTFSKSPLDKDDEDETISECDSDEGADIMSDSDSDED